MKGHVMPQLVFHKAKVHNKSNSIDVNIVILFTVNNNTHNFDLNQGQTTDLFWLAEGPHVITASDDVTNDVALTAPFTVPNKGIRINLVDDPAQQGKLKMNYAAWADDDPH